MRSTLRAVGGSIAMTIPKAIVDELGLKADKRPKYKLADLLAQCDPNAERDPELEEWLNAPSVGREIIE